MNRFLLLIALFLMPTAGHADYFFWQDPETKLSITFPDTWKKQHNQGPNDILTIIAPSDHGWPQCTVKTKEDKRYTIYPSQYGDDIQREAVSVPFWHDYMGAYDAYTLNTVYDGSGLGRWLASYAYATYDNRNGTAHEKRRALMFASLYYDTLYIVECSALNHAYDKWDNDFRSIIKSIDFKKAFHEHKHGEYHNFLTDADLHFWSQTSPAGSTTY